MKLIQTIALSLFCTSLMASCNKSTASNASDQTMDAANETNATTIAKEVSNLKGVAGQIASVNKTGKAVFLVAFDKSGDDKDKALSIAKKALGKKNNSAAIVELNTADANNKDLVAKLRLAGAPLPLIIVMDKNGIPAGGLLLSEATPEALSEMIPSPKYSEVIKALDEKKSVFIVAYKEKMLEKTKAIINCQSATKSMKNNSVVVLLNIDDKANKSLIENLRVSTVSTEPVIYVINKSGQITGTFVSSTAVTQLTTAANKVVSGCGSGCAGGCN